jgi:two-component system sensor histidine kinase DegS
MEMMNTTLGPKEQLLEELREKIKSIEKRLSENDAIVSQNQLEVDRLQKQNVHANAMLQRVKDSFDSVPREDIMKAYEAAMDSRQRLVTMRSQLEGLQDAQNYLREYKEKLAETITRMADVAIDRMGGGANGADRFKLSLAGEQVVRMLNSQESERRSLATALHDGPTQSLSNFILQAEICQRLFDRDPATATVELHNLKGQANLTFQKMREFIFELRPMMLDDLGLVATLRRNAENYNQKFEDKTIKFNLTGPERRFSSHVEVMMFRAAQILLSNSINILGGKEVDIKLSVGDDTIIMVIEDNGRAVDTDTELDPNQETASLNNISRLRERIELLGGKLDFFSNDGNNIAEVTLPFDPNETLA